MTDAGTSDAAESPRALAVCRLAVVLMLAAIGVRVLTTYDPMPGWSGDPFAVESPSVGLTPRGSLVVDAVLIGAAGVLMAGLAVRGLTPRWWEVLLAAAGAGAAAVHARAGIADYIPGSCWASAIVAGLAASVAAREPALRRLLAAGLLGLLAPLLLKGGVQLAIDHPETYRSFLRDRSAFLSAQGWSEGSPMALAYERRLSQAEASGWFGMANVYAGVMACMFVVCAGLAAAAMRRRTTGATVGVLAAAAIAAALGVWMAGAKGGYAVAIAGLPLLAAPGIVAYYIRTPSGPGWALRRRWVRDGVGVAVGLACIAAPLIAVTVRGLIGERIGELSLFFRWFYISTATRIFADHPLLGVGPGGFKDAYMLAKPAISPEDVSSPHSVLFDYAATLGIGGLAWGALWLLWTCRAGRTLLSPEPAPMPTAPVRGEVLVIGFALAVPALAATYMELDLASPEASLARMGGLVLGVVVAAAALVAFRSATASKWASAALAAGAMVAVAHAQIELTAVTPGSAALLTVLIATAGVSRIPTVTRAWERFVAPAFAAILLIGVLRGLPDVWRWEAALRNAYARAVIVTRLTDQLKQLQTGSPSAKDVSAFVSALESALDGPRAATPEVSIQKLHAQVCHDIRPILREAHALQPDDLPTFQAFSRVALVSATDRPMPHAEALEEVVGLTMVFAEAHPSAASWGWAAVIARSVPPGHTPIDHQLHSLDALERAAALAPHSTMYASLAATRASELGNAAKARHWAEIALKNHANSRLDPLTGLSAPARVIMQRLASGSRPDPGKP